MKKLISLILAVFLVSAGCIPVMAETEHPKYVFLFIGDGMGLPQVTATNYFLGDLENPDSEIPVPGQLCFTAFESLGLMSNYSLTSFITDSAASGTAMSSGVKTKHKYLGLDGENKQVKNLAEYAREANREVGIITSVTVDHATPAAFYAHELDRESYAAIIQDALKSKTANFLAGGGTSHANGKIKTVKRIADRYGWQTISMKEEFLSMARSGDNMLVLDPAETPTGGLVLEIDRLRREKEGEENYSLADFLQMGIDSLDHEKGFFIMCEGGQIDWACHANDAATALYEVIALGDAVQVALDFAEEHPGEVLIVVTADHETGGMTLGGANTEYDTHFEYLARQTMSYAEMDQMVLELIRNDATFEDALAMIEKYFGLNQKAEDPLAMTEAEFAHLKQGWELSQDLFFEPDEILTRLYNEYEPVVVAACRILDRKAAISFTTFEHSALPVPVYAWGNGAEAFEGYYDNTDLFQLLFDAMGFQTAE